MGAGIDHIFVFLYLVESETFLLVELNGYIRPSLVVFFFCYSEIINSEKNLIGAICFTCISSVTKPSLILVISFHCLLFVGKET